MENENICLICFEKLETNDSCKIKFSCIHKNMIHYNCLIKWNEYKCPLCMSNTHFEPNYIKEYLYSRSKLLNCELSKYNIQETLKPLNNNDLIFLINYHPKSFMMDDNEIMENISNKINNYYSGHSGMSYAFTMRWIEKELNIFK